jgi:hypothetical protein
MVYNRFAVKSRQAPRLDESQLRSWLPSFIETRFSTRRLAKVFSALGLAWAPTQFEKTDV